MWEERKEVTTVGGRGASRNRGRQLNFHHHHPSFLLPDHFFLMMISFRAKSKWHRHPHTLIQLFLGNMGSPLLTEVSSLCTIIRQLVGNWGTGFAWEGCWCFNEIKMTEWSLKISILTSLCATKCETLANGTQALSQEKAAVTAWITQWIIGPCMWGSKQTHTYTHITHITHHTSHTPHNPASATKIDNDKEISTFNK